MAQTVDELRNEIRLSVGRFERQESTGFTKETLAAICERVGFDIGDGRLPPKSDMRAEIASRIGDIDDGRDGATAFRKTELASIAAKLTEE